MASPSPGLLRSSHLGVTENQKRWLVAGVALNKILIPKIRPFVEKEVDKEYNNLKTSHNIHTQSTPGRLQRWPAPRGKFLKYENINGNDAHPKLPGGRYDYPRFDCRVLSHVDFARLYVENYMAKFNAFDEHCDASAVLLLLGGVPVFSAAVQAAAGDVRMARNDWAHCVFSKWDPVKFQQSFIEMERLVRVMTLPAADEGKLLGELKDWETKGTHLCMNSPVDPDLLQLVQQEVKSLQDDVENMSVEDAKEKTKVRDELQKIRIALEDITQRLERLEDDHQNLQDHTKLIEIRVDSVEHSVTDLKALDEVTKERVDNLQDEVKELRKTSDEFFTRGNPGNTILLAEPYLAPNDQNFTGRDRERTEIVSALTTGFTRIVSIYGPPGFGKSEVTKAVGHDLKSKGKAVYRIELDEVDTKDKLISSLLCFVSDQPLAHLEPVDFLLRKFSKIKDPVYFILDNADNLLESTVKDGVIKLINNILTNSPRVAFLVATRESSEFNILKSRGQQSVKIGPLDKLSSQNLVQQWLPEACDADCRKIAQFCERMPFAIRLFCNNVSQNELPLNLAIDNFISLIESDLSRLDDPEELKVERLNCILDSSFQRLSLQNKESYLSLSVIPGTFNVQVAAAVCGIATCDAERKLQTLQRKCLVDSSSQPGSYKVHKILRLHARQKGEREMNEILLSSKIRFLQFYISVFVELKERFLSGQSLSAFIDFYEDKQSIISSLIDGCSESSTRDSVFEVLIQGVLLLDTVLWSDRASFDEIYDTAITEAKQNGNNAYNQLVLSKTFSEVTWGKEEVETMQLKHEIQACNSDQQKGELSCYLGIHRLTSGQIKDGVDHLEKCVSYLNETNNPSMKVLKVVTLQILSLYYESTNKVSRAVKCCKDATEECETARNHDLLVISKMTSKGFRIEDDKVTTEGNQPLVLAVYFHITKAAKIFTAEKRMKLFEGDALQMKKQVDAILSANFKVGLFHFHRSIVGVLAEMARYDEAIKSIQAAIDLMKEGPNQRSVCGVNSSDQGSKDDMFGDLNDDEHKEALARNYSYLSVLQFRIKDYRASLQSQRRSLDIRRELFGEQHPDIADSYHELAIILRTLGDCNSALHFQQRALDIRVNLPEGNPLKIAAGYHELGVTQCKMEEYSSAFRTHERALKIRVENLGEQHRDTASSYHELGITQWYLKKYDGALDSHRKALSIILDVMGEHHSTTADSYYEIGKTQFCLEDYLAALRSHLDAFHTRLELFGEQHPDTANSCYEIGNARFEMEWYVSALEYHKRALKARQVLCAGTQHADIAQSHCQVGRTQCQMGNYDQAVQSLNRALSFSLLVEQHIETADIYYELGKVFFCKEECTSALVMHRLALGIREIKLDEKHVAIGDSLFHVGLVHWKLRNYHISLQMTQRALDIRLACFGPKHAGTAECYFQRGLILCEFSRYDEALDSHQQALKTRQELFGNLHTATANSHLETGNAQIKVCKFDSAFRSLEDALQMRTELVAKEDEEVADLSHNWKVEESLLQDYKSPLELYQRVLTVTAEYSSCVQSQNSLLRQRLSSLKQQLIKKATCYHNVGKREFFQKLRDLPTVLRVHQRDLHLRLALLGEKHEDTASSYYSVGQVQYEMMDYTSALQSHQRALEIRLEMFGDNHTDTATTYNDLGATQYALGDYTSALQSFQRALTIRREILGDNYPHTATSYNNIGATQYALENYTSALYSYQQALKITRETFGHNHPQTAISYDNTGVTRYALGDYTKALQSHQRALTIRHQMFGDTHSHTANSYFYIGNTQQALEDYTSALQSHQRALTIRRKIFGDKHPHTASSYNNIGVTQQALGDYTLALQSHQRALTISREMLGDNHPDTATSYNNIGNTQRTLGDYTLAVQLHQRALTIRREVFGDNHPRTADSYNNIGATQHDMGDYTSALQSHQRALTIRREVFGDNHPRTADSYNNIGIMQQALGDYTSALQSHQRALTIRRELLGDNHPDTASSYNNIGNTQGTLGDYTSALQSQQLALTKRREMLGDNHPHTANSYNNIGVTQQALGNYTSAVHSHQRALEIRREIFGDNHPDTASSYENIGNTQHDMKDYTSALQSHQRALTIRREIYGDNHQQTAVSYDNIGATQQALGNYTSALQSHQLALTIRREMLGNNHPGTASSYNNIGNTQQALGDYTSALQSHQRALTIRREIYGDNHQQTAVSYDNIGATQQALGNYTSALQSHQLALKIRREIFGDNHPHTASSYNNIAVTVLQLFSHTE